MGLDISFNRAQALAAGMQCQEFRNGDDKDITREKAIRDADPDDYDRNQPGYWDWLHSNESCIRVSGMEENGLEFWVVDNGTEEFCNVRANTWGRVYTPLTAWLKVNNIPWDEF